MLSPSRRREMAFSILPPTMTVKAPDRAARRAARTFVCIPPRAQHASTTTRHGIELGVAGAPFVDQLGIGIFAGVFVEQAELVGEDDQSVGFDQVGHQRAQGVVVAKTDFVGDNGVVFVNDGHHAEIEQRSQGATGIEVALAIRKVIVGQQDLCGVQIMSFELGFPGLHQPHLTNGGCSLKFSAVAQGELSNPAGSCLQPQNPTTPPPLQRQQ